MLMVATKLDMRDEDHSLHALMVNVCTAGSTIPNISCKTTTGDDTKLNMKDEGHGLYPLIGHVRLTGLLVWMRALFRGCLHCDVRARRWDTWAMHLFISSCCRYISTTTCLLSYVLCVCMVCLCRCSSATFNSQLTISSPYKLAIHRAIFLPYMTSSDAHPMTSLPLVIVSNIPWN